MLVEMAFVGLWGCTLCTQGKCCGPNCGQNLGFSPCVCFSDGCLCYYTLEGSEIHLGSVGRSVKGIVVSVIVYGWRAAMSAEYLQILYLFAEMIGRCKGP